MAGSRTVFAASRTGCTPFTFNTVTYGIHKLHRLHTATHHFYLSRPIFVRRPSFDSWLQALQDEMRAAVRDAVAFQRDLHVREEEESAVAIREEGGGNVEITAGERRAFASAVTPIHAEARAQYGRDLLAMLDL